MDTRVSLRWASPYVSLLAALALLSACGGGGGSSGGSGTGNPNPTPPNENPPPAVASAEAFPAEVTVAAAINESRPNFVVVNATFFNLPDEELYFASGYSESGINNATFEIISTTEVMITVTFKSPPLATAGTHSDVLAMQLCRDIECESVVPGTTIFIPVTYTVVTPELGQGPTVTFERMAYSATGVIEDLSGGFSGPLDLFVPMQYSQFGEAAPHVTVTHSNNALQPGVSISMQEGNTGFTLDVARASDLAFGTFHDTITVEVCADAACLYPAEGSPYTLTFDYTISRSVTVDGPNGYTWTAVDFDPAAFVWDRTSERILATRTVIPAGQLTSDDGRLASIDPIEADVEWEISLGARAQHLAVSDDGQYVYVAVGEALNEIRKIRLADRSTMTTFALPSPEMQIQGLDIAPDAPDTLMATVKSSGGDAMLLFNSNGVVDRYEFLGDLMTGTFGADAFSYYAYDAASDLLYTFSLSASAIDDPTVQAVDLNGTHMGWSDIRYDGGLLFESHGAVYEPSTNQLVGTMQLGTSASGPDSSVVAPAADLGRAFYWYVDGAVQLHAFSLAGNTSIDRIATGSRSTFELIRWGTDGLAFVNSTQTNRLILLRGNFVRPAD